MDSTPVITAAKVGQDHHAPLVPKGRLLPFVLVTALFFLWGIPNNLNDILIRQFMKSFEMTRLQAGLVQSAFYMGYFLLAMPAGQIMRRAGYKAGHPDRIVPLRCGLHPLLARGDHRAILVLSDGALRHCKWAGVS